MKAAVLLFLFFLCAGCNSQPPRKDHGPRPEEKAGVTIIDPEEVRASNLAECR